MSSASAPSQDFSKRPAAVQRSAIHARAGQLSCPTSHQLLDFLLQRDRCVAGPPPPSRRTQRFEAGGPALFLTARRRLGIGVLLYCDATEGWSGRALTHAVPTCWTMTLDTHDLLFCIKCARECSHYTAASSIFSVLYRLCSTHPSALPSSISA